jgi:hypothetical protein
MSANEAPVEPGSVFGPPPIELPAPYTGTLQYPLDALLALARALLILVEQHHDALLQAARDAEDDDGEAEQLDYLGDVYLVDWALNPTRFRARGLAQDRVFSAVELEHFDNLRTAEYALFTLGRVTKSPWVSLADFVG